MRRTEQPSFSITQAENGTEDSERATRLALFLSTLQENPGAFSVVLGGFKTAEDAIQGAQTEGAKRYGDNLEDPEEVSYEDRVKYTLGQVVAHEDDECMTLDRETARVFQATIAHDPTEYPSSDDRISARRIMFLTAFVSEFVGVDTLGVERSGMPTNQVA